jgi:hypothetical protein
MLEESVPAALDQLTCSLAVSADALIDESDGVSTITQSLSHSLTE